jgi:hypothetical protein
MLIPIANSVTNNGFQRSTCSPCPWMLRLRAVQGHCPSPLGLYRELFFLGGGGGGAFAVFFAFWYSF